MIDHEFLQAISELMDKKLEPIKKDIVDMKSDIDTMKSDIDIMKSDIQKLQLHIENITDRNLQILAENHLSLVDKLNQAIKVSDKTILYEIKVNYLTERVEKLEQEIKEIKSQTA